MEPDPKAKFLATLNLALSLSLPIQLQPFFLTLEAKLLPSFGFPF
jgi:hypothetical protein